MKSEAKRAADKRFMDKNKARYKRWNTSFPKEEAEQTNLFLADKNMGKADLIRFGYRELKMLDELDRE